eukprot:m.365099 g.365099  ORF g.365099 m.365099 type:complete len:78 (+) comp29955_c0_seq1:1811-2044(+)
MPPTLVLSNVLKSPFDGVATVDCIGDAGLVTLSKCWRNSVMSFVSTSQLATYLSLNNTHHTPRDATPRLAQPMAPRA